jgi:YD repeat-containing protein
MTIGYKATYNYKCRHKLYEIGQEYKMDGMPEICCFGFHYCKIAEDVLKYYDYFPKEFKLLEIEDLSDKTVHQGNKSCSNHIKIIREITDPEELFNLLGMCYIFNDKGLEIAYKEKNGYSYEQTYNDNDEKLIWKDNRGNIIEFIYDESGLKTGKKEIYNGVSSFVTFNKNGMILSFKDSNEYEYEYTYNDDGKVLTHYDSSGWYYEYTYYENGNMASYKDPNNYSEYDVGGKLTKHVYLDARTKCPV